MKTRSSRKSADANPPRKRGALPNWDRHDSDPPGTQAAKPRTTVGPDWGNLDKFAVSADFNPETVANADTLHIPRDLLESLRRSGLVLMWGTAEIRGMPATQMLSSYLRGGWQVVCKGDLGGNLDFLLPDGSDGDQIHIGECILLARPAGIDAKARLAHERAALEPVEGSRQMVISGLDMPGGNHPSALRSNKINVTRESIEVPRDRDY